MRCRWAHTSSRSRARSPSGYSRTTRGLRGAPIDAERMSPHLPLHLRHGVQPRVHVPAMKKLTGWDWAFLIIFGSIIGMIVSVAVFGG